MNWLSSFRRCRRRYRHRCCRYLHRRRRHSRQSRRDHRRDGSAKILNC